MADDEDSEDAENWEQDKKAAKLHAEDAGFQDLLMKSSKIIAIYLNDRNITNELFKAVLEFLRMSFGLLKVETLQAVLAPILKSMFGSDQGLLGKHRLIVRKTLSKLSRRLTPAVLAKMMPESGKALLAYVERMRRRQVSKKEREVLLKYIGDDSDNEDEEQDQEEDDMDFSDDGDEVPEDVGIPVVSLLARENGEQ